jgi:hypothetical protein
MSCSRLNLACLAIALLVFGLNQPAAAASGDDANAKAEQPGASPAIRVGMIGLDTSHVVAFPKVMNAPDAEGPLAEARIVAGFPGGSPDIPSSANRVDKFTEQLRADGLTIYDSIDELLENVDAVMVESVDGRPHLQQARPVIAAGKPLYLDKPLAGSLADAVTIYRLAEEAGVPCFSSSSLRFSPAFLERRGAQGKLIPPPPSERGIESCTAWSPMKIEPHHPDLFWYGIHGVEILFTVMGPGCVEVTRESPEKVVGRWKDGTVGTFLGNAKLHGQSYGAAVTGGEKPGYVGTYTGYKPLVVEIARFFKTGQPPVAAQETLEIYAFMEAADESKRQGGKTVKIADVLEKAKKKAEAALAGE